MNREEARKIAELMLAYADGKTIQIHDKTRWIDHTDPGFFESSKYRIKPEPKEAWIRFDTQGRLSEVYASPVSGCVHMREVLE